MVPNTAADQTTHFQNAINAAQTQGLPLFIPAGTYKINTVNVTAACEIYSARGATLEPYTTAPVINVATPSPGTTIGPVRIAGLVIDAQSTAFASGVSNPGLIMVSEVDTIMIEQCALFRSLSSAISLNKGTGNVQDNEIFGCDVGIFSLDANGMQMTNNQIEWSGNNGIMIWRSTQGGDNSLVSRNTIGPTQNLSGGSGQYGNAINVYLADFVITADNIIFSSAFSGIRYNQCNGAQVLGNQVWGSSENAIYLEFGTTKSIVANNLVDGGSGGISFANSDQGSRLCDIIGNSVVNCTSGIFAEADALVEGNQIDSCSEWAIVLYPTNNNAGFGTDKILGQALGNTIKNTPGGIGFYQGDTTYGRILIGGNMISEYTNSSTWGAIVPINYNGATGAVTRVPGSTDLGNATTTTFANVKLYQSFSFT
jgi:uncharacterized secreted repeat protein (TIGR03808 family)